VGKSVNERPVDGWRLAYVDGGLEVRDAEEECVFVVVDVAGFLPELPICLQHARLSRFGVLVDLDRVVLEECVSTVWSCQSGGVLDTMRSLGCTTDL